MIGSGEHTQNFLAAMAQGGRKLLPNTGQTSYRRYDLSNPLSINGANDLLPFSNLSSDRTSAFPFSFFIAIQFVLDGHVTFCLPTVVIGRVSF